MLLYFSIFITRVNKEIQTRCIDVVFIREFTGSYSKHSQSCICSYSFLLRENTVSKVPVFIIKILLNIPPVCIDFNVEETIPHSAPKIPLYRLITVSLYIPLHSWHWICMSCFLSIGISLILTLINLQV